MTDRQHNEAPAQEFEAIFHPGELRGAFPAGTTLLEAAESLGFRFRLACNRRGSCGRCRMKVDGAASEPTAEEVRVLGRELLGDGFRLGCQATLRGNVSVEISDTYLAGRYKILEEGLATVGTVRPRVEKYYLELEPQTTRNNPADLQLVLDSLPVPISASPPVRLLRDLAGILRSGGHKITVAVGGDRLVAIEPGDTRETMLGLAADIGTTTVVVGLYDLRSGRSFGVESTVNPQSRFGADAISRLTVALEGDKRRRELAADIRTALKLLAERLLEKAGAEESHVYDAVLAGNTIMGHLLLGLDPAALAQAPYTPVSQSGLEFWGGDNFLPMAPGAGAYLMPNIGGFVGGDTVAVILATELHQCREAALAIDIGTNGEIVLVKDGEMTAASTAAGPAFEGAGMEFGMGGESGAIEGFEIDGDGPRLKVIGDSEPRGICGSGLIDIIAALIRTGVVDRTGRMVAAGTADHRRPAWAGERVSEYRGEPAFLVHAGKNSEIYFTQRDVRELQLAKGAIRAGIEILLAEAGLEWGDLSRIDLAGAFGSFIRPESALAIGLLPPVPLKIVRSVGNAAFQGARLALFDSEARSRAEEIARRCRHLALSGREDFRTAFADFMLFGEGEGL